MAHMGFHPIPQVTKVSPSTVTTSNVLCKPGIRLAKNRTRENAHAKEKK